MPRQKKPFVVQKRKNTKTYILTLNETSGLPDRICKEWQRKSFQNFPHELISYSCPKTKAAADAGAVALIAYLKKIYEEGSVRRITITDITVGDWLEKFTHIETSPMTGINASKNRPYSVDTLDSYKTITMPDISKPEYRMPIFSLENAPAGVTIDYNSGVIGISPDAVFTQQTMVIMVKAVFEEKILTKQFTLNIVRDAEPGKFSPRYLGKTDAITYTNIVKILFTDKDSGEVTAREGDYISYIGESQPGTSHWKNGYVLRWNGGAWVQLDPLNSANTDYYMGALRDITDGAEMGVFSSILAKKIMALEATIEELQSQILRLYNPTDKTKYIELNGRQGIIKSGNYSKDKAGFQIDYDGNAEFNNGKFRGHIEAKSGSFEGVVKATDGEFTGVVNARDGSFTGAVNARGGTFESIEITGNSLFHGMLDCGPLKVKADQAKNTRFPASGWYNSHDYMYTIRDQLLNHLNISLPTGGRAYDITIRVDGGTFYDGTPITSIRFWQFTQPGETYDRYSVTGSNNFGISGLISERAYMDFYVILGATNADLLLEGLPNNGTRSGSVYKLLDISDTTRSFVMVKN